jgi:hypothetical protein
MIVAVLLRMVGRMKHARRRTGMSERRSGETARLADGELRRRPRWPWWLIAGGVALLAGSVLEKESAAGAWSTALAVASLILFGFLLRGPQVRYGRIVVIVSCVGAGLAIALGLTAAVELALTVDPIQLLILGAVGLAALGFSLFLFATWAPGWPYVEPMALAVLAVFVGAVSLTGLRILSSPLDEPTPVGYGELYVQGHTHGPISLVVATSPQNEDRSVSLDIENLSRSPARWALLLAADARLDHLILDSGVNERRFAVPIGADVAGFWGAQLFWGRTAPGDFDEISGNAVTSYAAASVSRTAVVLPSYGPGYPPGPDAASAAIIRRVLGGQPAQPSSWHPDITVDAGPLDLLSTVTQARPPLADPTWLRWNSHGITFVSFATLNQHADDIVRNYFFALATLVGVAGAGLLAGVQAAVHIAAHRERPRPQRR